MNITFVSTMAGTPWTGSEELWAATAKRAVAHGHRVAASVFRWTAVPRQITALQQAGVTILWRQRSAPPTPDEFAMKAMNLLGGRPFERSAQLPLIGGFGADRAFRAIVSTQPDVLCLNQGSPYDLMDAPRSRSFLRMLASSAIPYVILCHSIADSPTGSATVRQEVGALYAGARWIGFVAEHNRRAAERHLATAFPNANVVVNPVNLAGPVPIPWPTELLPSFACVGRLDPAHKGQDLLFAALSGREWQARSWRVQLYGTGADEQYLRALAHHYELDRRVQFCGHVPDVRTIWESNHLLVMPSRAEGTPLALVEAMLCGRPAIVTDVGGNAEWIADGVSGYVAEAASSRSFGHALERAWSDRSDWEIRGRAAHNAADTKLDRDPGRTLLDILERAVSKR